MKLLHDIDSSDQFSLNIELWVSWPITVLLERLSQLVVFENVKILIFQPIVLFEDADNL